MLSRIACLYIPSFPLAAHLRANPERRFDPIAILDRASSAARIVALSKAALDLGIALHFSVPQAKAISRKVTFRARDNEAEKSCHHALVETAESLSPRVEEGQDGIVYLDTFREKNEAFLAETLVRRAQKVGLFIHVGIASSKLVARIAAQLSEETTIVPPGKEHDFLNSLDLLHLKPTVSQLELLHKWGISTIGAFSRLSERDVLVRLGKEGWQLHKQARGYDPRPLVPREPTVVYQEGKELEWEIGDLGLFMQLAQDLLKRLLLRLELLDLACRRIELQMKLEPQGVEVRHIDLPMPTRDENALLDLIRKEMERHPLLGPVIALKLQVQPERFYPTQLSLFGAPTMSNHELGTALARLTALLGPERVGSPQAVAGFRPEQFALSPFVYQSNEESNPSAPIKPRAAIRVFRPRIPIQVTIDKQHRRPRFIETNSSVSFPIDGMVQRAAGPWRSEDGWWTRQYVRREYWDVALSDNSLYRIYYDTVKKAWYADGIYD